MAKNMKLVIIDRNGWQKPLKVEKAVMRVGSAPGNDIHLASPQIAPTHLQISYLPENIGCKVLNLGHDLTLLRGDTQDALVSYTTTELIDGDEVLLGDYRIQFKLPLIAKNIQEADSLEASLFFPNASIYKDGATAGWLKIKNVGEQSPCQFHISVNGLPDDCVQIDPVPLLYSGAEEEIRIQLLHRGIYPSAGVSDLTIRVSAPAHYPREQVIIQQGIYVEPVFDQVLELIDDWVPVASPIEVRAEEDEEQKVPEFEAEPPVSHPAPPPPPPAEVIEDEPLEIFEEEVEVVEEIEEEIEPEEEPIVDEKVALPKAVVARSLPDDFWD